MTTATYSIAPGESAEDLAIRRKLALQLMQQGVDTSPVQHWAQGLARMGQAGLGGYELYQAKQEDEKERDAARTALLNMINPPPATPAARPSVPSPTGFAPAAMPDRPPSRGFTGTSPQGREYISGTPIYSQDEVNPLDLPQGDERDRVIRTVYGEAGNQGPVGQQAVAAVIRNRAANSGSTPTGVVTAPNQFEPWNTPQGRARMASLDPNSPQYAQISQAVDKAYAGDDPTGGATHFYSPTAQSALGRQPPSWASGQPGQDIGDHRFFRLGNGGPQPMPMGASAAPPQAAPPTMGAVAAQPQQQQITPQQRAQLTTLLGNRFTAPMAQQAIMANVMRDLTPTDPKFEKLKDEYGNETPLWVDPRRQTVTQASVAGRPVQSGAPAVEPPPPGVDAKVWREMQTKNLAGRTMEASSEDITKLRKEVGDLPSYKNLAQAAPVYRSMLSSAGNNTRASDLNLVYGLGKIFDPGSVVREGEMIMVKNTASVPDWFMGVVNSINGGAALTPETREAIMREAKIRIDAYRGLFDQDAGMYRRIATDNRMNPAHVIPDFGEFPEWTAPKTAPPPAAPPPATPDPQTRQAGQSTPMPQQSQPKATTIQDIRKKYRLE